MIFSRRFTLMDALTAIFHWLRHPLHLYPTMLLATVLVLPLVHSGKFARSTYIYGVVVMLVLGLAAFLYAMSWTKKSKQQLRQFALKSTAMAAVSLMALIWTGLGFLQRIPDLNLVSLLGQEPMLFCWVSLIIWLLMLACWMRVFSIAPHKLDRYIFGQHTDSPAINRALSGPGCIDIDDCRL